VTDSFLFDIGETRKQVRTHGTPYPVGSGPAGETCRTCKHLRRIKRANTYIKCGLMERYWTGGAGTDVKAKWPACKAWERKEE
jgi:hypothetical protein